MNYRLRCATILLSTLIRPDLATAQTVIAVSDLPSIRLTPKTDYRLKSPIAHPDTIRSHKTAMLERLFAQAAGFSTTDHRHSAAFAIGGIEITGEAMRERMLTGSSDLDRKARVVDRIWAVGAHADWAVGVNDGLSLGVAATKDRRAEPSILSGSTRIKGSALATDLTWSHGDHMRMSFGWRADRSTSPAVGAERLVELAEGAALREQGVRLTLSYLLEGRDPSHNAMFGIAAHDARVAAADLSTIGSAGRQDVQAALFFRRSF